MGSVEDLVSDPAPCPQCRHSALHTIAKNQNKQTDKKLYSAENWHQPGTVTAAVGSAEMTVTHMLSFKEKTRRDRSPDVKNANNYT